jgi:N-acetylglutamate synthase-like GNAT family acetyltransferase
MFTLRPARADDADAIRELIHRVRINPSGLKWERFLLAVDEQDDLIGCGQIKPHRDGTRELASIAVVPERRGQGVARAIIERLLAENEPPLYLTCRASLGVMYQKFGFQPVSYLQLPIYYQRILRAAQFLRSRGWMKEDLLVMRKG